MILDEKELENLPLKSRQDVVALRNAFAKLAFTNTDYFEIRPPDGVNIVNYYGRDKRFHFRINHPKYNASEKVTQFQCSYAPFKDSSLDAYSGILNLPSLVIRFQKWVDLLKALEEVNAELQDPFLKQFKDEFFAEYLPSQDEEDYVRTFEDGILNMLSDILGSVQLLLEQEVEKEKNDVISKVIELKENLQITSRAGIRKSLIDLLALTKRHGLKIAFSYLLDKLMSSGLDILINNAKRLIR
jgi:hypothetical protein